MIKTYLTSDWKDILLDEFDKTYFKELNHFIEQEYQDQLVYPEKQQLFTALNLTGFADTKVVILGQDPYHGPGQANGLAFSVTQGQKTPPSLKNIFKELHSDLQITDLNSPDLTPWASQGVLLLNATLTVEAKKPGSHQKKGWETFTDHIIKELSQSKSNLVFILWGAYAQNKGQFIDRTKHLVIESAHPSPFSVYRGFFGSKPFSATNAYLTQTGQTPINWSLKSPDLFS